MTDKERFRKFLEENEGKPMHMMEFLAALTDHKFDSDKKKKEGFGKLDFRKFHLEQGDDNDCIHLRYGDFYVLSITEEGYVMRGKNLPHGEGFGLDDDDRILVKK